MSRAQLKAYEVSVVGTDWTQTVHETSAGRAKYKYLLDVREAWPDISFKHLRCRSIGKPRTDEGFAKTAGYRGVPFARIGMRVEVGGKPGVIVGKNDSSNFDVLFDSGGTFNCHPNWAFKYFDDSGKLIAEFPGGAA